MSLWTKFLNLFLTDMKTDGDDYFDFDRDLNQNFIKIDNALCSLQNGYNVFCVNTGIVGSDGLPAFLKLEENILKTVGSFDLTTAQGKTYTITDELTKDVSELSDGEYNIFINPDTKQISLKNNKIHIDNIFPEDAAIGDYLLKVAKPPYDLEEKTANENLTGLKEVYAGSLTVSGGGKRLMNIKKFNLPIFLFASQKRLGLVQVDNSTIIVDRGIISAKTATATTKGIMQPDNKSIGISPEGVIGVVMATANRAGIILVDNSTITVNGSTISAKTATATTKGIMQPDNKSTVVNSAGVVSVPTNFNYPQYIPAQIIQLGWMNHEWKSKEELQYTVPDNGYVDLQFQNSLSKAGNSGFIFINDIRIAYFTRDNYSGLSTYLIPVKKGDVIKLSNDYPNTGTFCTIILSYFMPTK